MQESTFSEGFPFVSKIRHRMWSVMAEVMADAMWPGTVEDKRWAVVGSGRWRHGRRDDWMESENVGFKA